MRNMNGDAIRMVVASLLMASCATAQTVCFRDVKGVTLKAHVKGCPSVPTADTKVRTDGSGIALSCDFTTDGHDAAWFEFPCELTAFRRMVLDRTLSDGRHQVFVILTDSGGESHLFKFSGASGRGRTEVEILSENENPGEYFAWRWGGDDNQKIDWPVKTVAFGVNDRPDAFVGKVDAVFHSFETHE